MASLSKLQREYFKFRREYAPMLNAAKREMATAMQKGMIDAIAATAFSAGYRAPRSTPDQPIKLRKWRGRNDKQ